MDWVGWFEPACQGAWLFFLLLFARLRQGMVVKFCFPNLFFASTASFFFSSASHPRSHPRD